MNGKEKEMRLSSITVLSLVCAQIACLAPGCAADMRGEAQAVLLGMNEAALNHDAKRFRQLVAASAVPLSEEIHPENLHLAAFYDIVRTRCVGSDNVVFTVRTLQANPARRGFGELIERDIGVTRSGNVWRISSINPLP